MGGDGARCHRGGGDRRNSPPVRSRRPAAGHRHHRAGPSHRGDRRRTVRGAVHTGAVNGWGRARLGCEDAVVEDTKLTYIAEPDGVAPGKGYTHVVIGTGRMVALSGQIAFDADGNVVGPGDPAAQARQVFENLRRCLAAAGATFDNVIKLTYYVTDIAHLPAIRTARDAHIAPSHLPASTAVQVAALVHPDLLMEIEAFALLPDSE
ncbi:hypothetical protein F5544_36490 [Nocardia arthritidis]|uniref:RidA family protein n=1 Tax=Nocardia arthritidis TaxID=228602 RepID=A0A6G9YQ32_9NOCA|nr:hypothetical protein F5544_36490 [Nocardia arthritidis]